MAINNLSNLSINIYYFWKKEKYILISYLKR